MWLTLAKRTNLLIESFIARFQISGCFSHLSAEARRRSTLLQRGSFHSPAWFSTVSMFGLSFCRFLSAVFCMIGGEADAPPFTYSCLHLPLKVSKKTLPSLSFSYDNSQLCINSSVWPFKEEWHGIQWRRLSGNIYQMVTIGSLMHVLVPVLSLPLIPTLLLLNPGSKWSPQHDGILF